MLTYDVRIDWNNNGEYGETAENVTARVSQRSALTISYGRDNARALSPIAPGSAQFELDNRSGDYSPENNSSPLVGNLLPARPVRVQATLNSAVYTLFQGHLDDFDVQPSVRDLAVVRVTCLDAVAKLRGVYLDTPLYQGIRTGTAVHAVLDAIDWPIGKRMIDEGMTIMPYWWELGTDAFTAMERIVNSEGPTAMVTVDTDGNFVFHSRHHRLVTAASLTAQATWRDTAPTTFVSHATTAAPIGWWRLNEPSGTSAADSAGSNTGTYNGSPTLGATGLLVNDTGNTAVQFVNDVVRSVTIPGTSLNPTSLTVGAVFQASSWTGNNRVVQKGNSDNQWRLLRESSLFKWDVFGKGTITIPSLDTAKHSVFGTYDSSGLMELYVDGVLRGSLSVTAGSAPSSTDNIAIAQKPGSGSGGDGFNGVIDEVLLFNSRLSAATIKTLSDAALVPEVQLAPPLIYDHGWRDVVNDVTIQVAERAGDEFEVIWDTDVLTIVLAGTSKTITVQTNEPFVGAQEPESTVDYDIVTGSVTSMTLSRTSGQATDLTITAGGGTNLVLSRLQVRAQMLHTQRTILVKAENETSIQRYGRRSYTVDVPWAGEHDAKAIADLTLARYAERLPVVTVRMLAGPMQPAAVLASRGAQMLGRDLHDRVTIIEEQTGLDDQFYVERISHTVTNNGMLHETVFTCEKAPGTPLNVARFDTAGVGFDIGAFAEAGMDDPYTVARFDHADVGFDEGRFST